MKLKKQRVILQDRDISLLAKLQSFRFLEAEHIQKLFFPNASMSATYRRLRKLTNAKLLKSLRVQEYFCRGILPENKKLYFITKNGIELLNNELETNYNYKQISIANIHHDYVSINFLVWLEYISQKEKLPLLRIEDDRRLWKYLQEAKRNGEYHETVISDASFTFDDTRGGVSFHLEVINADIKRGNRTLAKKFRKYAQLSYKRNIHKVFKQKRIRAVLILTTGKQRIKNMQEILKRVGMSKGLFWFASFRDIDIKEQVLDHIWVDWEGNPKSIREEIFVSYDTKQRTS